MSTIRVEALNTIDDFPSAAGELADSFINVNPFVCRPWLRQYERNLLNSNESALYLIVYSGDVPLLIVPLIVETMTPLRLDKIKGMSNFYTNIYSVVMAPDLEQDEAELSRCVDAVADYFTRNFRSVPLVEMSPLRGSGAFYAMLAERFEQHGYKTRRYFVTANWHEPFDAQPDYSDYLKRRPGKLRSTLKRKGRILERETNYQITISKTSMTVAAAVKHFHEVYRESWKPEESYPRFIANIVTELAQHGKAMLGVIYIDEDPAAAQIWLKIADHWAVFKLAYRPKYSRYSPGSILTARMIEECMGMPGTRCIDFLSGDDGYKADWVSQRTAHWGLEVINTKNFWGRIIAFKRWLTGSRGSDETLLITAATARFELLDQNAKQAYES